MLSRIYWVSKFFYKAGAFSELTFSLWSFYLKEEKGCSQESRGAAWENEVQKTAVSW